MDAKHGQRVDERLLEPLESYEHLFLGLAGASAVGSEELGKRHPLRRR
jgi:hypothetical protein